MSVLSPALVAKAFVQDVVFSIVYFPVWWYTEGLASVLRWSWRQISYQAASYALGLWIKMFFVPMYGQHDWAGRAMSVFMRFVVLCGRGMALTVMVFVHLVLVAVWIVLPMALGFFLSLNLMRLFVS
jgi:hypothetical protein